ncbi:class I tRNA ligase family protein, partial [Candidatus Dojkabacteria bacterium]|nr:class I tRNA ligase family protein [Candidatus Dojkabacteria bacterium]
MMDYPQFKLYNTYKKEKEIFVSEHKGLVNMYVCGLTVYEQTHIGHAHMYTIVDFLSRFLTYTDYEVKQVRNYTDVGHLVSDADEGEDKMEKGARKSGVDPWQLADQMIGVAEEFFHELGVIEPTFKPRATENVDVMIEMIEDLIKKGYAYVTKEAIYFDVRKFPDYELYTGQKFDEKLTAARGDVQTGSQKKFPADFSLWFFTVGRFENHIMKWDSPWG